jgi:hypothetical protein
MIAESLKLFAVYFCAIASLAVSSHAISVIVPAPEVMLQRVNFVATGSLLKTEAGWELTVKDPLKGVLKPGDRVRLDTKGLFISEDYFTRLVGSESFLFVGNYDPIGRSVYPRFAGSSFWPQGVSKDDLSERTLEGVLAFARKSLGSAVSDAGAAASGAAGEVFQPNPAELELAGVPWSARQSGRKAAGTAGAPVAFDYAWIWLLLVPVGLVVLWRWRAGSR